MRLSYTAVDTYQSCPLKYKFREIDRISEPKSKEAIFGTLIHSVLKYVHTPATLSPTPDQALDYFSKGWNSDAYDSELEERAAFTQGVEIIQKYFEKNRPADYTIVDLESRFAIEIGDDTSGKHIVSGVIDRIDKTQDGYEIIDYKTARKMPSQDKVDHDLQLSIYLKAFLKRYPSEESNLDKITVSLYYLKHGVKLSSTRTKEQLDTVEENILGVIAAIEEKKFDPLFSPLCDWCGYQKICPLWKHKFSESQTLETKEAEKKIEEYLELKDRMSGDKLRLAKLQADILGYMEHEGVERVFGERGIIGKTVRKTYTYDEERLRAILEPLDQWESVLKVDGIALKSIVAALPSPVRKEVEDARTVSKESVSLSVKKNKIEADQDLAL